MNPKVCVIPTARLESENPGLYTLACNMARDAYGEDFVMPLFVEVQYEFGKLTGIGLPRDGRKPYGFIVSPA